jgi:template-activating factor I
MRTMAESYAKRRPALKGLKNFWLIALRGHSHVQYNIQHKEDVQALSYLEDIWVERDPREFRAFTIEFVRGSSLLHFFSGTLINSQNIDSTLLPTPFSTTPF